MALAALTLFAGISAASENRVVLVPDEARRVVLPGTLHPLARAGDDRGRADPSTVIHGVSIIFSRSADQQRALDALLEEQRDPSSSNYRKWLSPEEFGDRFGLSSSDAAKVSAWLKSKGFNVQGLSRSRTQISFSGTLEQVEAAFQTEMHVYVVNGVKHFANSTVLSMPKALAGVVASVRNLNDFRPKPRSRSRIVPFGPNFTSSISGDIYLAPEDYAAIYDLSPLYAIGLDGTGQTIAVAGQTYIYVSDVEAFRTASLLPANDPTLVNVPNSGTAKYVSEDDMPEADLDVEWSGAIAPKAQILFVYTGSNQNMSAFDAVTYAVDNKLAPVVSVSYGGCEAQAGQAEATTLQQLAQQANSQGQTFLGAAGDTGAADCDSQSSESARYGPAVDVPASIPEVTGVGGTEFNNQTNASTYWGSQTDIGSALSYIPELVWNETAADGTLAATGGGVSNFFNQPSWQASWVGSATGGTCPSPPCREVPDVALTAAAGIAGYLFCTDEFSDAGAVTGGSCLNGYRYTDDSLSVVGGTSASVQCFAGILALVNQALGTVGAEGLGNANPVLYQLAAQAPSAFHPTTTGNNDVPCRIGTTGCTTGEFGFSATGAYSETTGLGSVDAFNLVKAWLVSLNRTLITVTESGTGNGTVTGGGVSCTTGSPSGCTSSAANGAVVTLTATPGSTSTFGGWSGGGCSGTRPCSVTLNEAETVSASFVANSGTTFKLSVAEAGLGTGTVASNSGGISCGQSCSGSFSAGTPVTLTATASSGSEFGGWSGAGCAGQGACTVTMNVDQTATALFLSLNALLTVSETGTGSGTVTSAPAGISCGATCSAPFASGATVVLTATPASGSGFTGWSGGGCSGTGTCTVTMSSATNVTAEFDAASSFALTVVVDGTGSGTITGGGISCATNSTSGCSLSETGGSTVTLTATPASGSSFSGWSGACTGTGTCSITMDQVQAVAASFDKLSGSSPGHGGCETGGAEGWLAVLGSALAASMRKRRRL